MRQRAFLMLGLAVVLGIFAVFLLRGFIARHTQQAQTTTTVVVAKVAMNFGDSLSQQNLVAVPWPPESVPDGAFPTVAKILPPGVKRVALQAIARGEPVLRSKISGPGGRATLSAVIDKNMRAMTIRVNEVLGVAGFVVPGDRVDVLLTRRKNRTQTSQTTEILMQDVRVLGIDQQSSDQQNKPIVARAVTLEVTPKEAEKLTLASTIGTLSLVLRNTANTTPVDTGPVSVPDLTAVSAENSGIPTATATATATAKQTSSEQELNPLVTVRILRGTNVTDYQVKRGGVASSGRPKS